jgi:putative Mg2+ transporter-C (MgtC) family protein
VGFYALAIGATIATLLVLAAADLTERLLPQRRYAELRVRYRRSVGDAPRRFRDTLAAQDIKPLTLSHRLDGDTYEIGTTMTWHRTADETGLVAALTADADVVGFNLDNG